MATASSYEQPIFEAYRKLRAAWPQRGWSWDSRCACISSSFSVELETKAHSAAALALATEWTNKTLPSAPAHLRDVAERCGGLRSGQLLLSGLTSGRLFAFGLWWPWGDGMSISLRVGIGGIDESSEVFSRFRDLFGVSL
jgi:hypothetical protein